METRGTNPPATNDLSQKATAPQRSRQQLKSENVRGTFDDRQKPNHSTLYFVAPLSGRHMPTHPHVHHFPANRTVKFPTPLVAIQTTDSAFNPPIPFSPNPTNATLIPNHRVLHHQPALTTLPNHPKNLRPPLTLPNNDRRRLRHRPIPI